MHLRDFMHKWRISSPEIGKAINYTPGYAFRVAEGKIKAGRKFAEIIEAWTDGEVTKDEVMAFYEENKKQLQEIAQFKKRKKL